MPSRIIRDGWVESERINQLDAPSERFFLRLCLRADDYGRYHGNPTLLKSNLFPLREDVRSTDIPRLIAACETAGLLRCYDVAGKRYLEIPKFDQRMRAKVSKFPDPPKNAGQPSDICLTDDGGPPPESESESETESLSESRGRSGVPASLNTTAFHERWERWKKHWSDTFNYGRGMPIETSEQHLRDLAAMGPARAIEAMNNAIAKGNWRRPTVAAFPSDKTRPETTVETI
jgi:hypothetical protein